MKLLALLFSIFSVRNPGITSHFHSQPFQTPHALLLAVLSAISGAGLFLVLTAILSPRPVVLHVMASLQLTDVSLDKNLFESKTAATTIDLQEQEHSECTASDVTKTELGRECAPPRPHLLTPGDAHCALHHSGPLPPAC